MAGGRGRLELAVGSRLLLNGVPWTVESAEPQFGRLVLVDGEGRTEQRSIRWLVHHPDLRPARKAGDAGSQARALQPLPVADLTEDQLTRYRIRAEHVLEAATGFRDGSPRPRSAGQAAACLRPGHHHARYVRDL
ncbi:hypothetical protein [Kitasatospora sp. NPDC008115]|uniref:hypothetical protein n=1 Tax=Kitasatospora sp. NPDC008115 TaxID=3364022 RepID=UPI0036E65D2A